MLKAKLSTRTIGMTALGAGFDLERIGLCAMRGSDQRATGNEKPRLMGITERGTARNVEAPSGAPPIKSYHRVHGEQSLRWRGTDDEAGPSVHRISTKFPQAFPQAAVAHHGTDDPRAQLY